MLKQGLLGTYYHATRPYRWWNNRRQVKAGRAPVTVLFYHRVADDGANSWTCSTCMFARHMEWMAQQFDMVSLAEAQRRIRNGANHRPAVSITFDDGYAHNCAEALPLLVRMGIPCTYFVTTRHVLQGLPFKHDLDCGCTAQPNTIDQLRGLAEQGIEIGAHSRTHADLGRVGDPDQLYDEVVLAGRDLAHALERPVRYFAFPFGQPANLNALAFHMAREAGYLAVCSAYGGSNFPGDDAFHLQRMHGDENLLRLKNWLTGDPRKRNVERFSYAHLPAQAQPQAAGGP